MRGVDQRKEGDGRSSALLCSRTWHVVGADARMPTMLKRINHSMRIPAGPVLFTLPWLLPCTLVEPQLLRRATGLS